jgi:arylsulfatase
VTRRPDILFILADQWRSDSLSWLEHPVAETPFLDDLASRGVTFTSAYSNCPICIPARACLITGCTPNTVGRFGYREAVPWRYDPTLMTCLRDAGYQTLCVGKTHFDPSRACLGFEQIQLYDNLMTHPPGDDYARWLTLHAGPLVEDTARRIGSNSLLVHPWCGNEEWHPSSWTVTTAIDLLERRDPTRPFFLQVNFHRPHPPLDPPLAFLDRFSHKPLPDPPVGDWVGEHAFRREWRHDQIAGLLPPEALDRARRAYFAQCAHLDEQIGRLMFWLKKHRLAEDLVIVFSSDHGEHLGDHRLFRKSTFLEGSAGIPLVIRLPHDESPAGRRRNEPVALHDLMPTLLDVADVEIPHTVEGHSLLPLARGDDVAWRCCVHLEQAHSPLGPWQCVTDGRIKYAWITSTGDEFLFALDSDPHETRNLAGDEAWCDELVRWRGRLIDILRDRDEDGFVSAGRLTPGNRTPVIRERLLPHQG